MSGLVSIIIPGYNAAETILETLDSACGQTWRDLEVILVDDGSIDETAAIAAAYPDARVTVIRTENGGACRARNIGMRTAKGDYLQFMDADDLIESHKIELQMEDLLTGNRETEVAYGPWHEFRDLPSEPTSHGFSAGRHFDQPMEWLLASLEEGFYLPPHCWLIPATLVKSVGHWDERLMQNQDGEFFSRVLEVASSIRWVPDALSYYRSGNTQSLSNLRGRIYTESLLMAASLIRDRLLEYLGDDSSRRSTISALYLRILYRTDPYDREMVDRVWSEIRKLGLPPRTLCVGGKRFSQLKAFLGWHLAFKAKSLTTR
jgi:glycosyltransferase involved in cell wall biosynthesis